MMMQDSREATPDLVKLTGGSAPILDGETRLSGGHTILRYLTDEYLPAGNNFYPRNNIQKRAVIDMMMDWHLTTMSFAGKMVEHKMIGDEEYNKNQGVLFYYPEQFPKEVHKSLKMLANELKSKNYWGDVSSLTLADLLIFQELLGLSLIKFDLNKYTGLPAFVQNLYTAHPQVRDSTKQLQNFTASNNLPSYVHTEKL